MVNANLTDYERENDVNRQYLTTTHTTCENCGVNIDSCSEQCEKCDIEDWQGAGFLDDRGVVN